MLLLFLSLQQAAPVAPTVGDTIWLERVVETPAGAEVHAAQWIPAEPIGLLGRALIRREGSRTIVSYPAVAWRAGRIQVDIPGPIVIRADGTTDSLPVESRTLTVASVLPDSVPAEKLPVQPQAGIVVEAKGNTDLFILPGFKFGAVDSLVTNFHVPRSTLLMLVSAFAGRELVMRAYDVAKEEGYRFLSFGDAMLIL